MIEGVLPARRRAAARFAVRPARRRQVVVVPPLIAWGMGFAGRTRRNLSRGRVAGTAAGDAEFTRQRVPVARCGGWFRWAWLAGRGLTGCGAGGLGRLLRGVAAGANAKGVGQRGPGVVGIGHESDFRGGTARRSTVAARPESLNY